MSKVTKRWVERQLQTWTGILGLDHWHLRIDWSTPADEGFWAQVSRSDDYDRATIYFDAEWSTWTQDELLPILVHELLHVAVRDMSRAHDFALEAVADNTVAHNIAVAAWKRAEEGVVDRMARALATSYPV